MPHHQRLTVEGRITDVFFHRFVIQADDGGKLLADLGPNGAGMFELAVGLQVVIEGEMKPSELKVDRIGKAGGRLLTVPHGKPHEHGHHHAPADPAVALRAVTDAGLAPIGSPRRKPKHFEVLARAGRRLVECHVELDGFIRKEKPVDPSDPKWSDDLESAA